MFRFFFPACKLVFIAVCCKRQESRPTTSSVCKTQTFTATFQLCWSLLIKDKTLWSVLHKLLWAVRLCPSPGAATAQLQTSSPTGVLNHGGLEEAGIRGQNVVAIHVPQLKTLHSHVFFWTLTFYDHTNERQTSCCGASTVQRCQSLTQRCCFITFSSLELQIISCSQRFFNLATI